jgi:hypothetical protein
MQGQLANSLERIRLLVHILRMIVEPHEKQHPAVQKLRLHIKNLEEVAIEAMSIWLSNQSLDETRKIPFLKEIFKVAKVEESYKNSEIGKTVAPKTCRESDLLFRPRHINPCHFSEQGRFQTFTA